MAIPAIEQDYLCEFRFSLMILQTPLSLLSRTSMVSMSEPPKVSALKMIEAILLLHDTKIFRTI